MTELITKPFSNLDTKELYEICVLRQEVFVVEQNAAYLDNDGLDYNAIHFFVKEADRVIAYCRLIPDTLKYKEASVGRVVVLPTKRNLKLGHLLVKNALDYQLKNWGTTSNRISAQTYLIDFYAQYGYKIVSDEYLEDGLPHFEMLRS